MSTNSNGKSQEEALEQMLAQAKGLVFDCDGTLLDTMPTYYKSWQLACDELGLHFPIERFYSLAGATVHDIFALLLEEQKSNLQDTTTNKEGDIVPLTPSYCEVVKRKYHTQLTQDSNTPKLEPIHPIVNIVKKYHTKLPMAVASSGWKDHVESGLKSVGIHHMFDAIVTADDDDVQNPKPAPDMFLVACQRIGVDPKECAGFEDADFGMEALQSAGFMYACDVRLLRMYPRNVEKRKRDEES